MDDSSSVAGRYDEAGVTSESPPASAYPGTPRWVKIAGIIAVLVVVLVGLTHLTGVAPSTHVSPVEHGVNQP